MKINFDTWGPATVLIVAIVLIAVIAGGVVTVVNPDALSFQTYLEDMQRFAIALAGLGLARGIHLGAQSVAVGSAISDNSTTDSLAHTGSIPADEGDAGRPSA